LLKASTLFNFTAVSFLPLAEVKAISFVSPLLVTIFAAWLLAEQVNRARWIAVGVGFFGVVFIVRPGSDMLQWQAVLSLGAALCYSLYQIMTRSFSEREDSFATLFFSALVGCSVLTLLPPMYWQTPEPRHIPFLVFLGVAGAAGHFMLIKAMELENASFLSPLGYAQLVWVTLFGFLVFDDFPDDRAFIGMAIIVASGLYVALGHRFKAREVPETALE
jgi:drug/metabolite transporter (DMT)-like permease